MILVLTIIAIAVSFFIGFLIGLYKVGKRVGTLTIGNMKVDYDENGDPKMYCKLTRDIEVGDEYTIIRKNAKKSRSKVEKTDI